MCAGRHVSERPQPFFGVLAHCCGAGALVPGRSRGNAADFLEARTHGVRDRRTAAGSVVQFLRIVLQIVELGFVSCADRHPAAVGKRPQRTPAGRTRVLGFAVEVRPAFDSLRRGKLEPDSTVVDGVASGLIAIIGRVRL